MHHDYADIRNRIPEPPSWFDEFAVPRYCDFTPRDMANIYANEAALCEIECQNCRRRFRVAFSRSRMDDVVGYRKAQRPRTLAQLITEQYLAYGDPPNVHCCASGPTMSSDMRRVLEFWTRRKETNHEWQRDPTLEITFD